MSVSGRLSFKLPIGACVPFAVERFRNIRTSQSGVSLSVAPSARIRRFEGITTLSSM